MKQAIRLPLLLSVTTLFATACTPVPFEGQNTNYTYGNNYSTPAPNSAPTYSASAPVINAAVNPTPTRAPIPEAGPLSATNRAPAAPQVRAASTNHTNNHNHSAATHVHNAGSTAPVVHHAAANVPAANPTPVATVPQVPAATNNVAAASYTPPAATGNTNYTPPAAATNANAGNSYNTYAANNTGSANGNGYDYSNSGSNSSYSSYAATANNTATSTGSTTSAATNAGSSNNYYAGANTSYDTYTNTNTASTGSNNYAATNTTPAGGSGAAVQVFATVSRDKAERISQDINSQGLKAIVDQVDGLYKVRVPYASASQARANLIKVRSVSGTPGAFVTTR